MYFLYVCYISLNRMALLLCISITVIHIKVSMKIKWFVIFFSSPVSWDWIYFTFWSLLGKMSTERINKWQKIKYFPSSVAFSLQISIVPSAVVLYYVDFNQKLVWAHLFCFSRWTQVPNTIFRPILLNLSSCISY